MINSLELQWKLFVEMGLKWSGSNECLLYIFIPLAPGENSKALVPWKMLHVTVDLKPMLTYLPLDQMAAILQTTFSNAV